MTDAKTRLANRERQRRYREAHRDEINQQRKERYNARIAKGKCPRCGGKVKKGYTLCTECCEYQANLNRKYASTRKKAAGKTSTSAATAKKSAKSTKPAKTTKAAKTAKTAVKSTKSTKTAVKSTKITRPKKPAAKTAKSTVKAVKPKAAKPAAKAKPAKKTI